MPQAGAHCYSTASAAAAAVASGEAGQVVPGGSVVYVVDASASGASITYTLSPVGGGSPVTLDYTPTFPECQLLDWSDGLQLGWLVAAAWLAVAAVLFLRKAAHE